MKTPYGKPISSFSLLASSLCLLLIERLVGISIENEGKKTGTCAKIENISVTNQMKTCSE
jgi:hypothetical protein